MRKQTLFAVVFLLLTSLALWTVPPVIAQTAGIPEITWTRLQVRPTRSPIIKGTMTYGAGRSLSVTPKPRLVSGSQCF